MIRPVVEQSIYEALHGFVAHGRVWFELWPLSRSLQEDPHGEIEVGSGLGIGVTAADGRIRQHRHVPTMAATSAAWSLSLILA